MDIWADTGGQDLKGHERGVWVWLFLFRISIAT